MKVLMIYPAWPKLPGQTRFNLPPLGIIQAAACMPGWAEVEVIDENVREIPEDASPDLVGIGMMLTCQSPRAYELARGFRARGIPVVMGGLNVALCEEEAAREADAIVVGEGEGLIEIMMEDFRRGELKPIYKRDFFPDINALPLPRRDLHDKKRDYTYKGWELVDLVETSRGCRFNCYPCCVPFLGGRQHRIKPWEKVAADIDNCSDLLFIVDNSLEQSREYEMELFRRLADTGKRWVSHPITPDPKVLSLAAKGGCWYVYHAVFDISDKIADRIRMYHDHGIGVEGTILLGMDHHDEDFIKRFIDFLLTIELDLAEFTVLTPFPHTRVAAQMEEEGRIIDRDWAHYNAGTVVYQPKNISPERLQELYHQAWEAFYGKQTQTLRMAKLFMALPREMRRGSAGRKGEKA